MFWESGDAKNKKLKAFYELSPSAKAKVGPDVFVLFTSSRGTDMYRAEVDGDTVVGIGAVTFGERVPRALQEGIPLKEARLFEPVEIPEVYTDDRGRKWLRSANGSAILWRPFGGRGLQLFRGDVEDDTFVATSAVNLGERVPRKLAEQGTPLEHAIRYTPAPDSSRAAIPFWDLAA